jgi:hypothetical protein
MIIILGVQENVLLIPTRFLGFVNFVWEKVSINSITDCMQQLPFLLILDGINIWKYLNWEGCHRTVWKQS